jgi:hypothetical protein
MVKGSRILVSFIFILKKAVMLVNFTMWKKNTQDMGTYHSVEYSQLLPYREPQLKLQLYSTYPATRPAFIHQEIYQLKVVPRQM